MYLQNTIYINIDYRTDRKEHVEKELTKKVLRYMVLFLKNFFPFLRLKIKHCCIRFF